MSDIVERARQQAKCIYIAVDETVADDIADCLLKLAGEIERLRTQHAALVEAAQQMTTAI